MTCGAEPSRGTSAGTCRAIPPSLRKTCRERAATRRQAISSTSRRGTARCWASSRATRRLGHSPARPARFDPTKLSWIGTPAKETNVCIAYHTAQVQSATDLFEKQLILGDTGPGTGTRSYPKALNALMGTKFKIIGGFPASSDVFLAMERGEVEGICESLDSIRVRRPDWIPTKTVSILFQGGAAPNPELGGIPFVLDLARTAEQLKAIEFLYAGQGIGRPFVAPPDLPAERLKALREAFNATMQDAEFIAETKNSKLELAPEDGEHLAALITKIYATPKPIVDKVTSLIK